MDNPTTRSIGRQLVGQSPSQTAARRPKVYIAAAFRKFSDWHAESTDKAYGAIVDHAYVELLEDIERRFLDYGFATCLPHRDEGKWGQVYYAPQAIGALCFRHVETSDMIFALAEDGRGVHLELGYAAGLGGKPMILMYKEGTQPSTLTWGLPGLPHQWRDIGSPASTTLVEYGDSADLGFQLDRILAEWFPERRAAASGSRSSTHALVDLGSHTLKFQIQRFRPGRTPELLRQDRRSVGLMGDVDSSGRLSVRAIDSVVAQLEAWSVIVNELDCDAVTVVGTAALRRAPNTSDLAMRLERRFGWQLEILDADRELDYVYSAVMADYLHVQGQVAVLNVGGGSTQVGIGSAVIPELRIHAGLGTRALTQSWPWDGALSDDAYDQLLAHVRSVVDLVLPKGMNASRLVHTGGELDFLLRCQVPMRTSHTLSTHVSEVGVDEFERFANEFRRLSRSEACHLFDLDEAWAVGAVASNTIAVALARHLSVEAIVPSNLNVSDGVALASVGTPIRPG